MDKEIKECLIEFFNFIIKNNIYCDIIQNSHENRIVGFSILLINKKRDVEDFKEINIYFMNNEIRIENGNNHYIFRDKFKLINYLKDYLDLMDIIESNNDNFPKEFLIVFKLFKEILCNNCIIIEKYYYSSNNEFLTEFDLKIKCEYCFDPYYLDNNYYYYTGQFNEIIHNNYLENFHIIIANEEIELFNRNSKNFGYTVSFNNSKIEEIFYQIEKLIFSLNELQSNYIIRPSSF